MSLNADDALATERPVDSQSSVGPACNPIGATHNSELVDQFSRNVLQLQFLLDKSVTLNLKDHHKLQT